ncbi:DNA-deoxyinosine glycosylase [Selenomonas caprae]|uniref:G/U mismatch-specific uracil-DNA glycosylase n=2 Tax=Selenomonas TaxID=970 RepID=A0A1I3HH49_SELRU|nr:MULTISPECIES: DNA-deoxyinosine glycosylase [Selenomonas]MBQ1889695.1 DNA-deoxyinosine glycosylase [Selenomonas sp.]TYZ29170.1 DNA-deoxyinosine glycosylase [Selenomonas caprae]SFI34870.1 G/U mismatch-specific uracil-DNA glycosylase [Selenomonas ruminantium]
MNCTGFPPSIDKNCHTLILGSMPGVTSLQQQQYYAHPQNRFWPLMARLLNEPAAPADYQQRLQMLLSHHIALWDAIGSCERTGSLDSAIKNVQGNDFTALLQEYPRIRTICCNGGKSAQTFQRYNKELLHRTDIAFHFLPSTSPANARWRMDMLADAWSQAIHP